MRCTGCEREWSEPYPAECPRCGAALAADADASGGGMTPAAPLPEATNAEESVAEQAAQARPAGRRRTIKV